jgi:hypothetical protein
MKPSLFWDGTDRVYRNVGKQLAMYAAWQTQKSEGVKYAMAKA